MGEGNNLGGVNILWGIDSDRVFVDSLGQGGCTLWQQGDTIFAHMEL